VREPVVFNMHHLAVELTSSFKVLDSLMILKVMSFNSFGLTRRSS